MSPSKPVRVGCTACKWRGKRKYQSCDCYDPCTHTGFGYCLKCGSRVKSVAMLREEQKIDRAAS